MEAWWGRIHTKATLSDTLVSGPETSLIACGFSHYVIIGFTSNLIILQMNIIITLILYRMIILHMRSRNNEIEIQE